MNKNFLFVVTSHDQLGSTGTRSGSWLEELAAPYWRFKDAGYDVTIASPKGGAAPLDPMGLEEMWLSSAGQRFLDDAAATAALANSKLLNDIDSAGFAGVFLVGGTATTWDFPQNPALKTIIESLFAADKVVAAICHGVIGLTQAVDGDGEPILKGRSVTSISNAEDVLMGVDKIVPLLPEDVIRKLHGFYSAAEPFAEHVVVDRPFFTGQNPASADLLARTILDHLEKVAKAAAAEA